MKQNEEEAVCSGSAFVPRAKSRPFIAKTRPQHGDATWQITFLLNRRHGGGGQGFPHAGGGQWEGILEQVGYDHVFLMLDYT